MQEPDFQGGLCGSRPQPCLTISGTIRHDKHFGTLEREDRIKIVADVLFVLNQIAIGCIGALVNENSSI